MFESGNGVGDDAGAGLDVSFSILGQERANGDARVEIAGEIGVQDGAAVGSAAGGLDFFTDNSRVVAPSNLFFEANQPSPGVSTLASGDSRQYNWNLNAIHTLTEPAFRATSSIGTTFEDRELDLSNTSVTGLAGGAVNVNEGTVPQLFEEREHERTFSVYGQEQVSALNERLLVEVGLRAERSSANGSVTTIGFAISAHAKSSSTAR